MDRPRDNRDQRGEDFPKRPRIAVVSSAYPVRSETFVFREVHGLRKRGWDVITVSLNDPPEPAHEVLGKKEPASIIVYGNSMRATIGAAAREVINHPARSLRTMAAACGDALRWREAGPLRTRIRVVPQAFAAIGLASRLRDAKVRLLHCHFAHAPTTVGMYAAMHLGVPFSFVGHANDLYQRRVLLEPKLRRAAFVSCISHPHRDLYTSLVQRDASAYPIIRCGVDTQQFQVRSACDEAPDGEFSSDLHFGASILTVCRLVEKKGVDTLIRALASLLYGDRTWRLTIAGSGPDEQRLRALADDLGCSYAITWAGPVDSRQVRKLMNEADVFVLPCREDSNGDRDGIPVVLMEAMASGLPVITGDIASIRDLVRDGDTGLLAPANDANAVGQALCRLRNDRAVRVRLSRAGRRHVVAEFSQSVNIDRLENALCSALRWRIPVAHVDMPSIHSQKQTAWVGV